MYHDPTFCEVIQIDAKKAVEYWHLSYNNSIYNHPEFLDGLTNNTTWWLGLRKEKPLILWPVCLNKENTPTLLNDLFFVGPIWLYDITKIPSYKWLNHYRELSILFINQFIEKYNGFCFDLPFGMLDVRPFLPMNIQLPTSVSIDIQVRYTSRIVDLDNRTDDNIMNCMKLDRRQKIRQFERKSTLRLIDEYNEIEALAFYSQFILAKNFKDADAKIEYFKNVLLLINKFQGKIIFFKEETTGQFVSCSILFIHRKVCNLMFQMYSPVFRQSGGTPWVMNELIKYAKSLGCSVFDFNGGNHLDLAHDKHSYGADAFPYIRVISSDLNKSQ